MRTPYRQVDKELERLKRRINAAFGNFALAPFDQLNTITTVKRSSAKLYEKLDSENEAAYKRIAKTAYEDALSDARSAGFEQKKRTDPVLLIAALLVAYNAVTKYVYKHEVERKRMRLVEALMSDSGKQAMREDIRRAANAWWRQSQQYAIDTEDEAVIAAFSDCGVEKVKWIATIDERTCKTCRDRNGKIYPIDKVPDKPHYNCRCYLLPIKDLAEKP